MSTSQRSEKMNYDETDRRFSNGPLYIQISLPSSRIELQPNHILYKDDERGRMVPVYVKDITQRDYLYVIRDGKKVTEGVIEVKKVNKQYLTESDVEGGMIIVNNILMQK
ncbi:hypothetical protein LOTGIDRAFT_233852 [Lottia gigantea]|uniref:Uncharacterized protein n=1 Tax=Lottia gigantea TaxID=225164 RepID=V4A145_LOTGI|nr:hypothetical protein LOTGIDRAFT_233852 [Lottia gigantea]ESO90362.1 hypothetical protein LOTGIDRAFT_233852 [Lottia gigantea]